MLRVYQDAILIPYAVEVDGQIISLYDPVVHQRLEMDDPELDPRWVLCKRPCIVVGGDRFQACWNCAWMTQAGSTRLRCR